jgi:hypothetical protein
MRFRSSSPSLGLALFEAGLNSKWFPFSRRSRVASLALGILSTVFIWIVLPNFKQLIWKQTTGAFTPSLKSPPGHEKLIGNGTLGFQQIYAIGLADRSDRRDSIELAADVTNLHLTWIDAVSPSVMNPKTIPGTYKHPAVLPGVIGCWRSHMNLIRRIVREKITSSLIFEDDADWDIRIVEQMQQFAVATKELLSHGGQEKKHNQLTGSPYGEGWDILWIGHCGGFHGNLTSVPHYIIRNDETVPPAMAMDDMLFDPSPYLKWNETNPDIPCTAHAGRDPPGKTCDSPRLAPNDRIVQERAKPVCTAAYAISYQGARKILARVGGLSLTDVFAPVDQGFGDVCAGSTDLPGERTRCFTPSPPYVRGYKAQGMEVGDSDIRVTGTNGEKRTTGWSKGIMQSARLNANSIVSGVDFEPEDQYIRDGPEGKGDWRLRKDVEYRSYKKEVVIDKWIW